MFYLTLIVLGLLIGGVFLTALLIGDKKEARLEAQRKTVQEGIKQASQPVPGVWPPPISEAARPQLFQSTPPPPTKTREKNKQIIRAFFLVRNYAIGTVILAYIISSCVPHADFGTVLLATAFAVLALWGVIAKLRQIRPPSSRL